MKLLRYGEPGRERPGLLAPDGTVRDLSAEIGDVSGPALASDVLARLRSLDPTRLPLVREPGRIGPCVGHVPKFICIGLNYSDHARETGMAAPAEPVLFMKATSALSGPNDDVIRPRGATKVDWEVELGVVIGRRASYVDEVDALDHVAGYCTVHDVSERAFQTERGGQWVKGKSADSFGPIGPWLVTRDEVPDPQALSLWLSVNGERVQDGTTGNMIFGVAFLVSYVSQFMTLMPGDIISTGTPAGVGLGMRPPRFLNAGDEVELEVVGLGRQRQVVVETMP